jgi:hypothetical protein
MAITPHTDDAKTNLKYCGRFHPVRPSPPLRIHDLSRRLNPRTDLSRARVPHEEIPLIVFPSREACLFMVDSTKPIHKFSYITIYNTFCIGREYLDNRHWKVHSMKMATFKTNQYVIGKPRRERKIPLESLIDRREIQLSAER